jgi:hypothetical protein
MHMTTSQPTSKMPTRRISLLSSPPALWLAPLSMLLLAACVTPLTIAPGTPEAQVRARLGPPDAEYRIPGAQEGSRLEYDTGWFGRATYMVDFGTDGRAIQARQVLTENHFANIRVGLDTADSIRREFGKPTEIVPSPLGHGCTIWEYPYLEATVWNSLMSIAFDDKGIVRSVYNGQDPRYIVNR